MEAYGHGLQRTGRVMMARLGARGRNPRGGRLAELGRQARNLAEQAVGHAGTALDVAASAAVELGESVGAAASDTADAYREALDDVRDTLPTFKDVIAQATRMPGVSVDRSLYLAKALGKRRDRIVVRDAITTTPARAGIDERELARMARRSIAKESHRTTLISTAAGIPGGVALAATVPADLVQFWMHLLRTLQKLSYLYGWRDLVYLDGREPDEAKRAAIVLFLAMMAGIEEADDALRQLAIMRVAGATEKDLREALLREPYLTTVASASASLGQRTATRVTGQVAGKAVPIVGAVISGRISNASFNEMAKRLHDQLKSYGG